MLLRKLRTILALGPACLLINLYSAPARPNAETRPEIAAQAVDEAVTGAAENGQSVHNSLMLVISGLLIVQTLLIVGLQRSRINNKQAKKALKRSQKALEERVVDRTNELRTINNQLYEEIARHEITEELLRETQNYLSSILNSMPSILIGVTRQGYITHWNSAAERETKVFAPDALGKNLAEVCPELAINIESIHKAIDTGVAQVNENIQDNSNGERQYNDLTVYPLTSTNVEGAVIRIDDVTLRVRVENMMIQNEKMMSLGELAAGMAHEINNPLSAILHGVQNIYRRTSSGLTKNHEIADALDISVEQVRQYLQVRDIFRFVDGIRDAGERAAKIVTNMLEFSRSSSRKHTPVDIVQLLEQSLELSTNMFDLRAPDGIEALLISREFAEEIPLVPCSAMEIQQVVLNLLRNASQSFASGNYGAQDPQITLRAKHKGTWVHIEIEDNGQGMIEAVKRHIFEPFFTTKDVGQGTGLGLSVSYFIITEHHAGFIEVDSSPGKGTRFTIKLPLEKTAAGARQTQSRTDVH